MLVEKSLMQLKTWKGLIKRGKKKSQEGSYI
jgi:hypothetical protein